MAMTVDVVEFTRSDPAPLLAWIDRLSEAGDGSGWINFGPALTPEEFASVPHRSGLGKWFSGRGPAVPMATWTPPDAAGGNGPAMVGVQHGTGPNALDRLRAAGLDLPPGWTRKQDHAKHGIVAELPDHPDGRAMVGWLIDAMRELSPLIPTGEEWLAEVHHG